MTTPSAKPLGLLLPLDEKIYTIDEDALAYMKLLTGIQNDDELKRHIMAVQVEAYAIYPYPCIRRFAFLQMKLGRLPAYQQLLALGKQRKNPIFLDIGCCFGNDIRKAVADGYPSECAIGSDLHPEFWELGHKLFESTPETFPVPFVPGDAFDPAHLDIVPPFNAPPETPVPQLSSLTSLNPLRGHVSAIHASSFFHLFSEEKQAHLAHALAGLLSPEPGWMILGSHMGRPEKGQLVSKFHDNPHTVTMFYHSPDTWSELWDGQVFEKGAVKVETVLNEVERPDRAEEINSAGESSSRFYLLPWSVIRV